MFYLTADALHRGSLLRSRVWFASGLIGFGVTVINIIPFAILLLVALRHDRTDWRQAIKRCAMMTGCIVCSGVLLHLLMLPFVQPDLPHDSLTSADSQTPTEPMSQKPHAAKRLMKFIKFNQGRALWEAPALLAWTFAAPLPTASATQFAPQGHIRPRVRLKMPDPMTRESLLLCLLVSTVVCMGAYGLFIGGTNSQRLGLATVAVLIFDAALFTLWGRYTPLFLYALHWQPCLLVLLMGLGHWGGCMGWAAIGSCAMLLSAEVMWNVRFLQFAFSAL
jgi:hypothetical protein